MTKMQILKKIGEVDDQLLCWADKKPKMYPLKLKKAELERLLEATSTIYELYTKCSDVKGDKDDNS